MPDPHPRQAALLLLRRVSGMLAIVFSLSACSSTRRVVSLDVVTFNYLNRPILDVYIDGKSGDSSTAYPQTGGSTIAGVKLQLGPKLVTWKLDGKRGMARNGETVTARNALELQDVPKDAVFLAIHIYPDETVELITSQHYPRKTEKGKSMALAVSQETASPWK